jgi:hypothetical protein
LDTGTIGTPEASDTKVACSGIITAGSSEILYTDDVDPGGTLGSPHNYCVCVIGEDDGIRGAYTSSGTWTLYGGHTKGFYATPHYILADATSVKDASAHQSIYLEMESYI